MASYNLLVMLIALSIRNCYRFLCIMRLQARQQGAILGMLMADATSNSPGLVRGAPGVGQSRRVALLSHSLAVKPVETRPCAELLTSSPAFFIGIL